MAKYRINPGNVGFGRKRDSQFATLIETAIEHAKPVRIGVNWGSLDGELLTRMMDENARLPEPKEARAVIQKVSGMQDLIAVYTEFAALGLRSFAPLVTACPGCGRTTSTYFQELADKIQSYVREQMPLWREHYLGVENMTLAVMGCVVNGPGESKHANIGISLPGTGEEPAAPVFITQLMQRYEDE